MVSVSVVRCFSAVMISRKAEGAVISPPVEMPAWLCEAVQLTASSYSTLSRSVTTSMSFPCLATIGVLILVASHPSCASAKSSNGTTVGIFKVPYSGKFGGGFNLAVQEKIAKLNSANIKSHPSRPLHSGMRAHISNAHTYVR